MRQAVPPSDDSPFTELDEALTRASEVTAPDGDDLQPESTPRRIITLSLAFALAVLLLSGVIGYTSAFVAVQRSTDHTDERFGVLESDLQQRRSAAAEQNASRDAQNASRDAQLAELRRLVCVFADHAQPRDQSVEDIRTSYGCTTTPFPTPPASAPSSPRVTATGTRRGGGTNSPGLAAPQPTPPVPSQQVPPPPAGDPGDNKLVCVDLPLLPKICL